MTALARFWFGGLAWARLYRRLELVELRLDPPPAVIAAPTGVDFGFLEPHELAAYDALGAPAGADVARERLAKGDRCYVARSEGAILSARWISDGRAYVAYLGSWLDLGPTEVYLSETFTLPARRGAGLSGAAGTRLAHALAAEGCVRILAGVLSENRGGRRAYEKAGYRRVGRIGYVRLGPWRRDFRR